MTCPAPAGINAAAAQASALYDAAVCESLAALADSWLEEDAAGTGFSSTSSVSVPALLRGPEGRIRLEACLLGLRRLARGSTNSWTGSLGGPHAALCHSSSWQNRKRGA